MANCKQVVGLRVGILPDPVAGQATSTLLTQVEELRKWQQAAKMDTVALDEAVCLMSGPPPPAATEKVPEPSAPLNSAPVSSAVQQQIGTATSPEVPASKAAASDGEKAADQTSPSVATPAPQAQVQAATEEDATLDLVAEAAAPTEAKAPAVALAPKGSAGLAEGGAAGSKNRPSPCWLRSSSGSAAGSAGFSGLCESESEMVRGNFSRIIHRHLGRLVYDIHFISESVTIRVQSPIKQRASRQKSNDSHAQRGRYPRVRHQTSPAAFVCS